VSWLIGQSQKDRTRIDVWRRIEEIETHDIGPEEQNAVPCVAYEVTAETSYTTFLGLRRPENQMPKGIALFCYAWMEAPRALGRDFPAVKRCERQGATIDTSKRSKR